MILNLQVLRAIAALMVVFHHSRDFMEPAFPTIKNITLGAAGVDIFFVLSGVVIGMSGQKEVSAAGFWVKRFIRVIPMYWIALLLVAFAIGLGLRPLGLQDSDATVANLLKSAFFIPFERSHGAVMPLLGVGWTLNFEIFFYLVFGALCFKPPRSRAITLGAIMVGLISLGMVMPIDNPVWFTFTNPMLLEFVAGLVLAETILKNRALAGDASTGLGLILIGLAGFAFSVLVLDTETLGFGRVIFLGIPAFFIVTGAIYLERGGVVEDRAGWQLIGASSYSLYLFHLFVLQVLQIAAMKLGFDLQVPLIGLLIAGSGVVASVFVGIYIHLYLEVPMTRGLGRLDRRKTPRLSKV